MRILTMQIKNYQYGIGGSVIKYLELIEAFLDRGWEVHHISPKGFANLHHPLFTHHGVNDSHFTPSFIPFSIRASRSYLSIYKKNRVNAIVTFSFLEGLIGIVLKAIDKNTKLIVSVHSDQVAVYMMDRKFLTRTIYKHFLIFVEKLVMKYSDKIIFVSEYNRRLVMERTGFSDLGKTLVVYNNIPQRALTVTRESAVRFNPDKKTIGYVGSLHARGKGLVYLIGAFHSIKEKVPDSQLVIVGDGPDKGKLEKLVQELELTEDVIFTGFQQNPIPYIQGFDIFILPSLHEAFGLVLLEALSSGIPVLGSRVGGIPEVLKYEQLLFNPADEQAITEKVVKLLQNHSVYQEAVELCRTRIPVFQFDWNEEMVKVVQAVVE